MHDRIRELAMQADLYAKSEYDKWTPTADFSGVPHIKSIFSEKFAELLIQEHVNLLKQEWYDLNNLPSITGESPRDVGLRVGKKGQVIVLIEKIKQHFGVTQ